MSYVKRDTIQRGLPERVKVTISLDDGRALFGLDWDPQTVYLTEAAPVLIVRRNGGTVETVAGDAASAVKFLREVLETAEYQGKIRD